MMGSLTEWILQALRTHGAWSVFGGVLLEQVIIPIPSPTILMGAGFVLIPETASWSVAFLRATTQIVFPALVASTLGALGLYFLARWGGKVFVDKFQKFLGFTWADVEKLKTHFTQRGEALSLFTLRAVPIVPLSLISVVAGVLEIPFKTFMVWSVLGLIPRCFFLALLGWQTGYKTLALAKGVDRLESLLSLLLVGGIVGGVWWIRRQVNRD